jgi:hypothetical protein
MRGLGCGGIVGAFMGRNQCAGGRRIIHHEAAKGTKKWGRERMNKEEISTTNIQYTI